MSCVLGKDKRKASCSKKGFACISCGWDEDVADHRKAIIDQYGLQKDPKDGLLCFKEVKKK